MVKKSLTWSSSKIYIVAVQAKPLRHLLTISEDAWFLASISVQLAAFADAWLWNPTDSKQPFRSLPTSPLTPYNGSKTDSHDGLLSTQAV